MTRKQSWTPSHSLTSRQVNTSPTAVQPRPACRSVAMASAGVSDVPRPLFYAATHVGHGGYTHKSPPPFALEPLACLGSAVADALHQLRPSSRSPRAAWVTSAAVASRLPFQAAAWPSAVAAYSTAKSLIRLTSTVSRGADFLLRGFAPPSELIHRRLSAPSCPRLHRFTPGRSQTRGLVPLMLQPCIKLPFERLLPWSILPSRPHTCRCCCDPLTPPSHEGLGSPHLVAHRLAPRASSPLSRRRR